MALPFGPAPVQQPSPRDAAASRGAHEATAGDVSHLCRGEIQKICHAQLLQSQAKVGCVYSLLEQHVCGDESSSSSFFENA
jgi:hypothetical protein